MVEPSAWRRCAAPLVVGALLACSSADQGGEVAEEATVEVPTGEAGPAPVVPDTAAGAVDSGAMSAGARADTAP